MEDDLEEFLKKTYVNAGEIDEKIVSLEEIKPDMRTKEYKIWVQKINHLYSLYNKETKEKIYKLIK